MNVTPSQAAPLAVRGVRKVFPGGVEALKGVSFRVSPNERTCLLGPNGAGKTTLIRLVTGALKPTTGDVHVFGAPTRGEDFLAAKRRLGIVPQQPGMYRDLRCREYLELVRTLYGAGSIDEVTRAFSLGDFLDRPMATLSGGQQRRLSIAAAVLPKPELLLLDEPTAGLDPVAAREVHTWLKALMPGRTVVLCTHNLAEAEALCESAIILRAGQMLVHERIDRLRERARPELALRARQGPEVLAPALRARGFTPVEHGEALRVSVEDAERDAPALLRALLAEGLDVYECRVVQPTLEDLFLSMMKGGADGG